MNILNQQFGRLKVIKQIKLINKHHSKWLCKCICGKEVIVLRQSLVGGLTNSCGCLHKEISKKVCSKNFKTHGFSRTRIYTTWRNLVDRCMNKNSSGFKKYGAKGITVCKSWLKFENFKDDMYESYLDHCEKFGEKNTTIDRINNKKNYNKQNCKWSTWKEQECNRTNNIIITYKGKTQNLSNWADELKFPYKILWERIKKYKWTVERAFNYPISKLRHKLD